MDLFPYTFLLPVCIKDTTKTSPSSQEAYESSLGLQQASMAPGDIEERTLSEPVAEVLKPDKGKSLNVCCELCICHMTVMVSVNASYSLITVACFSV